MAEKGEQTGHKAPTGSLEEVREKFGTLIVKGVANAVLHKDYRGQGDRVLLNTTAEGIRGPKNGKASDMDEEGTAFIDLALTPEDAEKVYKDLGRALEEHKKKK